MRTRALHERLALPSLVPRTLILALSVLWTSSACEAERRTPEPDITEADTDPPADTVNGPADIDTSLPEVIVTDREVRNGTTAWVGHVVDGDTVNVWVGDFNPKRHTIRLIALAAPECFKAQRSTPDGAGTSCVSDDEIHGYASFVALKEMVEDRRVTLTCDVPPGELCPLDVWNRTLAYLEFDGKDAGVEMTKGGHAFVYVVFPSSKTAEMCAGVYDARERKVGMWALGDESYVIGRMSSDTRSWYNSQHDRRCDEALAN